MTHVPQSAETAVGIKAAVAAPTIPHPASRFAAADESRLGSASAFGQGYVPIDELAVIDAHGQDAQPCL